MKISIKRVYDKPEPTDGYRVLVDRLWPRGIRKEALQINEWCKEVAPSPELRMWFNHDPKRFAEFAARYKHELEQTGVAEALRARASASEGLTLIYAAKDTKNNHAVVLQDYLQS